MRELDPRTVPLRGTHLVEASAGCGKTHTITHLYERLVVEEALDVSEILVVTYTRAATAELRERIRRRLREAAEERPPGAERERLTTAVRSFDEAAVLTIHGFCQRALSENAFESRVAFDVELVPDLSPLLTEVVEDFWTRELHDAPRILVEHLQQKRLGPASLVSLARKVTADPDMPVLPERAGADLEAAEARWRAAQGAAAAVWREDRAEVVTLLCEHGGLNRNSYRPQTIRDRWGPGIEAMLSARRPGVFGDLGRLAPSRMVLRARSAPPSSPFFDACEELLAAEEVLTEALEAHRIALELSLVRFVRSELARRKERSGTQGYDDLLHRLHAALRSNGGDDLLARLRDRYRAALIDEFQDTDPVQYEIFRRTFRGGERALFLIGDPKQAIYAFRGADVFAYLEAAKDAADARHTLSVNWRSDPSLVRAVNEVFGSARDPFLVPDISFQPVRARDGATDALGGALAGAPPLELLLIDPADDRVETTRGKVKKDWASQHLPAAVAGEIVRLLSAGATLGGRPLEPGDVAVLCRTNAEAANVQGALRELGVPAVLEGDRSVFETHDAESLERVLAAMASPRDAGAVRAALVTPLLGVTGDALSAMARDEAEWERRLGCFERWSRTFREEGFVQAFRQVLDEERVVERLLARMDGERRLTNVLHLGELLHDAAARHHLGPQALLRWLEEMRRDESARGAMASESAQIRLESDARAVRLTTIHRSKGLEYPVVYCPFLWDGRLLFAPDRARVRFHDAEDGRRLKLDLGSGSLEAHLAEASREALAENLRLLYVALTRAQHRCAVVWGRFDWRGDQHPALGYLLHPPEGEGGDRMEASRARLAALGDAELASDLERLRAAAGGAIAVRPIGLGPAPTWEGEARGAAMLRARTFERAIDRSFRVSSFSGLSSSAESEAESWEAVVGRDDARPQVDAGVETAGPLEEAKVTLHDFPAGPRPGLLLHELFEHLDFRDADGETVREEVRRRLGAYGFEPRWVEPVTRALGEVLDTPLDRTGFTLREVPRERRLDEMEFTLPVTSQLTPARLAAVFERHGAPAASPGYAARLGRLGFGQLRGYLRGFVDLVFEHGGRFWLVDYKSNRLGDTPSSYSQPAMAAAMAHHHYYLQSHLYAAALHRHLASRGTGPAAATGPGGWDWEAGFGGVLYLFVRGMGPSNPPGSGVFCHRPSLALIEALLAVLDGREAA